MSSTFSAKAGSLERLKVRNRCGCSRCASQMRWIVRNERPTAAAIARPVQWVVSPGGSALVRANTFAIHRHGRRARRPGLVVQEPVHPFLGVAPLPTPNRRAAYADATRHFENGQPIGRVQHNAGALYVLKRSTSISNNRCQARAFLA